MFCHTCIKELGQQISITKKSLINISILEINSRHGTEIEEIIEETWKKEKLEMFKIWQRILNTKLQQERRKEDLEEVNIAVN